MQYTRPALVPLGLAAAALAAALPASALTAPPEVLASYRAASQAPAAAPAKAATTASTPRKTAAASARAKGKAKTRVATATTAAIPVAAALPVAATATATAAITPAITPAVAKPSPAAASSKMSAEAGTLVSWVRQSGDNHGVPFAVIDKRNARVFVFSADGQLRGSAPVLLGLARGDDTVPGIGEKPLSEVKPEERTTPAGRFVAEHGTNMRGEHVVWVDYDAAVSMHPVLTTNPKEHRLQRLATPSVADNRISYGCVNVPTAFFQNVLLKTLDAPRPIVYVLPETRPLAATFAGLAGNRAGVLRVSSSGTGAAHR
jgi:hypothetical protein